jgi:hypothetical protein
MILLSEIIANSIYWQDIPRYFVPLKSGDYIYVSVFLNFSMYSQYIGNRLIFGCLAIKIKEGKT